MFLLPSPSPDPLLQHLHDSATQNSTALLDISWTEGK